ncbi:hypothetical protein CTAYLR_003918 [Chrysophaeum taylorii]|uniref:Uncharacterized protein n=1 Tax=Chrysophaeum taylorii TaxID=2483200 RepID=A0AAD7UBM9_9STRA|nr:hypothetical protein CTAYLR_003918 [Chrysophaeum taylorii]
MACVCLDSISGPEEKSDDRRIVVVAASQVDEDDLDDEDDATARVVAKTAAEALAGSGRSSSNARSSGSTVATKQVREEAEGEDDEAAEVARRSAELSAELRSMNDAPKPGDFVPAEESSKRAAEVMRHKKTAVLRFNTKPKLGVEYLKGLGLWDGRPETLATWIDEQLNGGGLSKRRAGEFFGGTLAMAQATFDCWLQRCMSGKLGPGVSLDEALRTLLRRFRLPGEAQCIDRVMERFAAAFKRANPAGSAKPWPYSEVAAYVLSFSLVMLNTDLHSQNVRDGERMTVDGFITNNRGINDDDGDLPEELLRSLYAGVKDEEIKMDEGDLYESELITYMGARKAGWLEKFNKGPVPIVKSQWHRLWFVLNDGCLYYFSSPADADAAHKPPRAIIPLDQGLEVTRPNCAAPGREFSLLRRRPTTRRRVERASSHTFLLGIHAASQQRGGGGDHDAGSGVRDDALVTPRRRRHPPEHKQEWVIKSVKNVGGAPGRVGTATEIRLRAKDVDDAQAWADALRAEEEALPAGGGVAVTAARAAKLAAVRARSSAPATLLQPSIKQDNSHTPLLAGWLRKRGEINTAFRRRYFALFSGVTCTTVEGEQTPADEPVLMYFKDETKFRELVAGGNRPYKGAVRLGAVREMRRKHAVSDAKVRDSARIALVTDDRVWLLAPLDENDADLDPWWYALEGACRAAQITCAAKGPTRPGPNKRTNSGLPALNGAATINATAVR